MILTSNVVHEVENRRKSGAAGRNIQLSETECHEAFCKRFLARNFLYENLFLCQYQICKQSLYHLQNFSMLCMHFTCELKKITIFSLNSGAAFVKISRSIVIKS
jgi:hypothetical protein